MKSEALLTVYGNDSLRMAIYHFFQQLNILEIPKDEKELLENEINPEKLMSVIVGIMDLFKRKGAGEVITVNDAQKLLLQQLLG